MEFTSRRLQLGLTDQERREYDQRRRARNCFIAIGILTVIIGFVAAQ